MRDDEAKLNEHWFEQPPLVLLERLREHYDVMDHLVEAIERAQDAYHEGVADAERQQQDQAEHMACAEAMDRQDADDADDRGGDEGGGDEGGGDEGGLNTRAESLCFAAQAFERLISVKRVAVAGGKATASVGDMAELKLSLLQR